MKKFIYSMAVISAAVVLSACGQENISSEIAEDYNELESADSEKLSERLGVTDTIAYEDEIEYNGFKYYSVDAEVIVPDTNKMGVYNLSDTDMDEEYAVEMVETAFDDGEYTEITWNRDYADTDAYVDPEKMIEEFEKSLSDSEEEHSLVDYYKWADAYAYINGNSLEYADYLYEGKMNGERVLAGFKNHTDSSGSVMYILRDDDYDEQYTITDSAKAERLGISNIECAYTADEAQVIAEEFISELGFNDYGFMRYDYKMCADDSGTTKPFGYLFYYGLSVSGATSLMKPYTDARGESITHEISLHEAVGQLIIGVDSDGVFYFEAFSPYTITETDTDDAELLSFEQINDAYSHIMENESYDAVFTTTTYIDKISLGYYIVKDDDGEVILIPVWAFWDDDIVDMYINAINGEEISYYEDFFG